MAQRDRQLPRGDDVQNDRAGRRARDVRNLADEIKNNADYRQLVEKCAQRWKTTYKKRAKDRQDMDVDPETNYVVGTTTRALGEDLAEYILIKSPPSWIQRDLLRPRRIEYYAHRDRCYDLDFIEIVLRAQYGDVEFRRLFPNRYLRRAEGEDAMSGRALYADRLRSIENDWNVTNRRAGLPRLYIEDWTRGEDDTIGLVEFITYLVDSEAVAGVLAGIKQLDGMKCKPKCVSCTEKRVKGAHCCGEKPSINIDKRTGEFSWCAEGEGTRPVYLSFECAPDCECEEGECENRDVQNGRQMRLCIFREPGKGWGVRTMSPIKEGVYVTEYCGEVLARLSEGNSARYDFPMIVPREKYSRRAVPVFEKPLVIAAADKANEARWFNHSCAPNMRQSATVVERYGIFYHHLSFWASREIVAGEELTFDYFPHLKQADSSTVHMFDPCRCGAKECRFSLSSTYQQHPAVMELLAERIAMEELQRREERTRARRNQHDDGGKKRKMGNVIGSSDEEEEEREKRRRWMEGKDFRARKTASCSGGNGGRMTPPSSSEDDDAEDGRVGRRGGEGENRELPGRRALERRIASSQPMRPTRPSASAERRRARIDASRRILGLRDSDGDSMETQPGGDRRPTVPAPTVSAARRQRRQGQLLASIPMPRAQLKSLPSGSNPAPPPLLHGHRLFQAGTVPLAGPAGPPTARKSAHPHPQGQLLASISMPRAQLKSAHPPQLQAPPPALPSRPPPLPAQPPLLPAQPPSVQRQLQQAVRAALQGAPLPAQRRMLMAAGRLAMNAAQQPGVPQPWFPPQAVQPSLAAAQAAGDVSRAIRLAARLAPPLQPARAPHHLPAAARPLPPHLPRLHPRNLMINEYQVLGGSPSTGSSADEEDDEERRRAEETSSGEDR